jgi:hypothetical protein
MSAEKYLLRIFILKYLAHQCTNEGAATRNIFELDGGDLVTAVNSLTFLVCLEI